MTTPPPKKTVIPIKRSTITLPTVPSVASKNFNDYSILLYGREKIGKSTLFASFPRCLFISTEPGLKGLSVFKVDVRNWKEIRSLVDALEAQPGIYERVVFDTVDLAYGWALDYVCESLGIEYPGETPTGKEDWGKSWGLVKKEFVSIVHRIARTGVGICFISHARENEMKAPSGEKYDRVYPSMSGQCRDVIEALVDFFFYCDYIRDNKNEVQRVIITEGDETLWAGCRQTGEQIEFPTILPLDKANGYQVLLDAFHGRHAGIDPRTLISHRTTAKATTKFLNKIKARAESPTRKGTPQRVAPTNAPPLKVPPRKLG